MKPIIQVEHLSKSYVISHQRKASYGSLRDELAGLFKRSSEPHLTHGSRETIWALNDVSFSVNQGEVVGIIGKNGSGKSTLLKILSRIVEPTRGQATLRGKVASLLEVGTGFHPELTGRENIYLNGAILGMKRREIERKFDEIVAFAEIEKFLDTPVKHYSSGMYVRLAFAVAAHLETEILIVDEILSAGDLQFRRKCLDRMGEARTEGWTIIFVSHDMAQIRSFCPAALLFDRGRIIANGDTVQVVDEYFRAVKTLGEIPNPNRRGETPYPANPGPKIEEVAILDKDGEFRTRFSSTEEFEVRMRVRPYHTSGKPFAATWFLHDSSGVQVAVGASFPMDSITYSQSIIGIRCTMSPESLIPGDYTIRLVFHIPHHDPFDDWPNAIGFQITESDPNRAGHAYPGAWTAQQYVRHKWQAE